MGHSKPLAIDLFAGLGGWTQGLLAEGYDVVGFDIERHRYPTMVKQYADELKTPAGNCSPQRWVDRQVKRLSGAGGNDVLDHMDVDAVWMEYPAQLVLQDVLTLDGRQFKDAALIVASPPCQEYSYMAMPWSRAKTIAAEYRSGARDVKKLTALFDACFRIQCEAIEAAGHFIPLVVENVRGAQPWVGRSRWNFGSYHLWGDVPALMPMAKAIKVPSFRFDGSGRSFQTASVEATKTIGHINKRNGHDHTRHLTNQAESDGVKQGGDWFNASQPSISRMCGSKSTARKTASAVIAKIPFSLAQHIARVWKPTDAERLARKVRA